MNKKILGIIPARYPSSRFPGKPLVEIQGKTMIQRVYEQVKKSKVDRVIVATDDERIYTHVTKFGGEAMLTSSTHNSGTERCGEVVQKLNEEKLFYDIVVNIQGDEPFISPEQINKVCEAFNKSGWCNIATLIKKIETEEELFNENVVKVVISEPPPYEELHPIKEALYFSRQTIPFLRGVDKKDWLVQHNFYKHIGIYAFDMDTLPQLVKLPESNLEKAEKLEQLRWLQDNYRIWVEETTQETMGIDTPSDLEKLNN